MKKKRLLIILPIVFIAIAMIVYIFRMPIFNEVLIIRHFIHKASKFSREYIRSFGNLGVFIFIAIFVLRTLLIIFPYTFMVMLGGNLFGPVKGFIYSMIGVFLSSTLAFFISRLLGKEFVKKLLKNRMDKLDLKIEKHGFKVIFLARVSAVFPYDILSYTAGLTRIKYKQFILGTLLGVASETFSLNYLGKNLSHPLSWNFLGAVALVILTIGIPFIYNKFIKKTKSLE